MFLIFLNCGHSRRCINTFRNESNLQQKIYIEHINSHKKIEIKIGKPIDLISNTDSLISPKEWGCGWELLGIKSDTIYVKKKALIDKIISIDSLDYYTNLGCWKANLEQQIKDSIKIWCYKNIEKKMALTGIKLIRYPEHENYSPSGDFIPLVLLLVTPFAPWENGKFRWDIFFKLIGVNLVYTTTVHILPRKLAEFKEYKMSEWNFVIIQE